MPELLSIHGRCPRCSQVLTVPAGQLQGLFRCARCQYRVLGATLMEEARLSPPRLAASPALPVVGPLDESEDDQHTRLHLPGGSDEEPETALPAQLVDAAGKSIPPRVMATPLRRFGDTRDDGDDQQTRLHVAGSFDPPRRTPRPERMETTVRGVPSPPALGRFGEADDADDQATRLHLGGADLLLEPSRGQTTRGMPAPPVAAIPPTAPIARFDAASDDDDNQNTRLQVPINYEEAAAPLQAAGMPALAARVSAPPRSSSPELRSPIAPRPSLPMNEPDLLVPGTSFGRGALKLSRWIDDWVRERHAVLLLTLAALCAIIAPVFDVLLGNPRQGATVIAANLTLFFLWALAYAWLGKLSNDAGVWDYRVAFSRLGTSARLALLDLRAFNARPMPLRWRVTAELSGAVGLVGLGLSSLLTLTHLVLSWPEGTALLFLWRLLSGSAVALSVISAREGANVPAGISPAPDVTAPAVTHFPAVVDLSLPLTPPSTQAGAPLHQVLEMLSEWRPRAWPNRDSYVAALERHLLERPGWAKVERERRLAAERGEGLAHLIVDDALLIEVVRGFDADIAERVSRRMRRLAKVWRGKPALIVVFDASRAELLEGAGAQHLEALHQAYPMLAVRMPSAVLG